MTGFRPSRKVACSICVFVCLVLAGISIQSAKWSHLHRPSDLQMGVSILGTGSFFRFRFPL